MSGGARQQIRPSVAELKDLPPELDISEGEEEEDDDDVPTYAPAAKLNRGPAPMLGTASSRWSAPQGPVQERREERITAGPSSLQNQTSKSVRFATGSEADPVREHSGTARGDTRSRGGAGKRFAVSLEDEDEANEHADDDPTSKMPTLAPLVGTIQERKPATLAGSTSQQKSERSGQSRFAARRQLDRDAGVIPPSHTRASAATLVKAADADAEVWLDDDGQPMSAFRKNRLIKQGLQPPATRPVQELKAPASVHIPRPNQTDDMQGPSISSLLRSISAENDAKIAAMSVDDVQDGIRDLQETFGADLLEKLKRRRMSPQDVSNEQSAAAEATLPGVMEGVVNPLPANARAAEAPSEEDTLTSIRNKYFPTESETLPNSMKWMQDPSHDIHEGGKGDDEYRFDFSGRQISIDDTKDEGGATILAGLHHHGDNQDRPGYSIAELLHLARSTLPSQRVMALQTIARVVSNYHEVSGEKVFAGDAAICADIMRQNARGQACVIASWYVEDRQANVRATSIACILACLTTTLAGRSPIKFVEPPRLNKAKREQNGDEEDGEGARVAAMPSVYEDDVRRGLATSLFRALQSSALSSDFDVASALDILLFLLRQSRHIGRLIGAQTKEIRTVCSMHLLKGTWPNSDCNEQVSLRVLELLLCFVASDRETALSLSTNGLIDPILRFVAVPPWMLAEEKAQVSAWQHMRAAVQVFTALGRYGISSDTYSRSHSIFVTLEQALRLNNFSATSALVQPFALSALEALLDLLSVWTVCASDPHQTQGHHDTTWSQVSEWWELALAGLQCAEKTGSESRIGSGRMLAQGASFQLLSNWIEGAARNRVDDLSSLLKQINSDIRTYTKAFVDDCTDAMRQLVEQVNVALRQDGPIGVAVVPHLERLGSASRALSAAVHMSSLEQCPSMSMDEQAMFVQTADLLMQRVPWSRLLEEEEAMQSGVAGPLQSITAMLDVVLQKMQAAGNASRWMQLLSALQDGQESAALEILANRLPLCINEEAKADLAVLRPFTKELVRQPSGSATKRAPLDPSPESLRETETLFVVTRASVSEEGDDVDPLSGAALWRSAAAGLPLRRDWPFAALDDLLHSGVCAALNRPDALASDWDANEMQIVRASLSLALHLWDSGDGSSSTPSCVPSSAEIWMGIIKVFMLEEEQSTNVRATGKITGRDIYRDEQVTRSLTRLFGLANKLQDGNGDTDDMERVAERQYGASQPFYQLYTSLVGLYDGISFGYELFGRALMAGLQMRYSVDYRRLLWNDYGHCLATITTKADDAPGGLQAYVNERENDDGVIRAMSMALLSGNVRMERNELLFAIATGQLARVFWSDGDASQHSRTRLKHLIVALFDEQRGGGSHLADVRHALLAWNAPHGQGQASTDEQTRRKRWIQLQLPTS